MRNSANSAESYLKNAWEESLDKTFREQITTAKFNLTINGQAVNYSPTNPNRIQDLYSAMGPLNGEYALPAQYALTHLMINSTSNSFLEWSEYEKKQTVLIDKSHNVNVTYNDKGIFIESTMEVQHKEDNDDNYFTATFLVTETLTPTSKTNEYKIKRTVRELEIKKQLTSSPA